MTDSEELRLIVDADDPGTSAGVSRGILRSHGDGIVTSAAGATRVRSARSSPWRVSEMHSWRSGE